MLPGGESRAEVSNKEGLGCPETLSLGLKLLISRGCAGREELRSCGTRRAWRPEEVNTASPCPNSRNETTRERTVAV